MSKGGLIIRLIDVVLILLLGFIGISDFTIKTQIKLPQGSQESSSSIKKNQVIYLRIDENSYFNIDNGKDNIIKLKELSQVEKEIVSFYKKNSDIVVIIEPHLDTIIQITVDLLDICEKYQIPKSINYEL